MKEGVCLFDGPTLHKLKAFVSYEEKEKSLSCFLFSTCNIVSDTSE